MTDEPTTPTEEFSRDQNIALLLAGNPVPDLTDYETSNVMTGMANALIKGFDYRVSNAPVYSVSCKEAGLVTSYFPTELLERRRRILQQRFGLPVTKEYSPAVTLTPIDPLSVVDMIPKETHDVFFAILVSFPFPNSELEGTIELKELICGYIKTEVYSDKSVGKWFQTFNTPYELEELIDQLKAKRREKRKQRRKANTGPQTIGSLDKILDTYTNDPSNTPE